MDLADQHFLNLKFVEKVATQYYKYRNPSTWSWISYLYTHTLEVKDK